MTARDIHRVKPGAEPYRHQGGPLGALLVHGFTGSPASLRPMGEWYASHGLSVEVPRLPGHGTHSEDLLGVEWNDWVEEAGGALERLAERCRDVFVVGLSMGASVAINLTAMRQDVVRALALINPYVVDRRLGAAPVLRLFTRTRPVGINDIKKPGQDEVGYDRIPLAVLPQLAKLLKRAQEELPGIRTPLLVFRSADDHLVKKASTALVMKRAGSSQKELVECTNSYHVSTLDYDAAMIQERILSFARAHLSEEAGAPESGQG